ncbi:hypothetical protein Pmar_PMAR015914 [Perkinsus marinus ATCC 50983]|uniref:Uncharacterized protein n=1 Tax=Perkinsus marinus (strain ATCC 50983 / TXsc) TaxID=423536 RepID=C5L429_PERM5|nr:hypothetical protein Pmar_PMAR015914 [Perkinsus marinus ATCC 50983]EER08495.1 hypothetical protein Pmar_PMAR015914 [Perkinsus marinus ATCC 50983]|eukprot:XP_002776679.1 hypothetical protein Pmar_PMAR015914 [Perkinsus marinus ATCC 50983]
MISDWHIYDLANYDMQRTSGDTEGARSLGVPTKNWLAAWQSEGMRNIKWFYLINASFAVDLVVISEAALSRFNLKLYATVKTFRRENQNTSSRKRVRY